MPYDSHTPALWALVNQRAFMANELTLIICNESMNKTWYCSQSLLQFMLFLVVTCCLLFIRQFPFPCLSVVVFAVFLALMSSSSSSLSSSSSSSSFPFLLAPSSLSWQITSCSSLIACLPFFHGEVCRLILLPRRVTLACGWLRFRRFGYETALKLMLSTCWFDALPREAIAGDSFCIPYNLIPFFYNI